MLLLGKPTENIFLKPPLRLCPTHQVKAQGAFHYMIPTGQRPPDRPLNNGTTFSDRSDLLHFENKTRENECKQCSKNLYLETAKIVNIL